MRRPLLGLAAMFATGSLLADGEAGPAEVVTLVALAAVLLGLALAAGAGRSAGGALAGAALALGSAAAGVEALQLESLGLRRLAVQAEREGRPLRLVGTVRGDAVERDGRVVFGMDVAGAEVNGRLLRAAGRARIDVGGRAEVPRLADGDGVAAWVSVRPPASDAARAPRRERGGCRAPRGGAPAQQGAGGPGSIDAAGHRARARARDGPGR